MYIDAKKQTTYVTNPQKLNQLDKIVYHYCTAQTFLDIIGNSTIRLSNIKKSNDTNEVYYAKEFISDVVKIIIHKYNNSTIKQYHILIDDTSDLVDSYFNEISTNVYAACFSENINLVDQWDRYADNSRGFAIGFSARKLSELQRNAHDQYVFGKIDYSLNNINDIATNYFQKYIQDSNCITDHTAIQNIIYQIIKSLVHYSALYKHPAFKQENEWRFVFNPFGRIKRLKNFDSYLSKQKYLYEQSDLINGFVRNSLKYRVIDNGKNITSFIDLNFKAIKNELLKEIIIGNQSHLTENDSDLLSFLHVNGYNVSSPSDIPKLKITKSNIPYYK